MEDLQIFSFEKENEDFIILHPDIKSSPDYDVIKNFRHRSTIENVLGSQSEVWLSKPKIIEVDKSSLSGELKIKTGGAYSKLYLLYCTCSFRPAPDTDFIRAGLRMRLSQDTNIKCNVIDLFPRDVDMTSNYKKEFKLSPSLKLSFEKVGGAEIALGEVSKAKEYVRYDPEILAFGTGDAEFGWDFNRSMSRPIRGIKDLYALFGAGDGLVTLQYFLTADIQTKLGKLSLPAFFDANDGSPLISKKIALTPENP